MPARLLRASILASTPQAEELSILRTALAITALVCIPIGLLNLGQDAVNFAALLFATSVVCVLGLGLTYVGRPRLAAAMLCLLILIDIFFTVIDGAGLQDPAVVALPLLLLMVAFFFRRRVLAVFTAAAIGGIVSLYWLHRAGVLTLASEPGVERVVILVVLLASTALFVAVIQRAWGRNLAALRDSEKRLELAIQAADLATWDWNIETGELRVNAVWLASLGYPPGYHPSSQDWMERIHPEDRDWVVESLQAHLRGEAPSWSPQYRLVTVQGSEVWLQCLGRVVERDSGGQARRVSGVHLDITDRRLAEQALHESEDRYRRLSRELHDSVTQTLYSLTLTLRAARLMLARGTTDLTSVLDRLDSLAAIALDEMRTLLRQGRPEALERHGLVPAVRDYLQGLRDRGELDIHLEVAGEADVPVETELALYRICQEALSNVRRHAGVDQAEMRLTLSSESVALTVEDRGVGFDPGQPSDPVGGFGLTSMRERVEGLGGTLRLTSQPGSGTRLWVEIPLAQVAATHG